MDDRDDARTVHAPRARRSDTDEPAYSLLVIAGPDRGRDLAVDAGSPRALVGTSAACELRLTDPKVSRRHLAVEMEGERLRIEDVGSSNGTRVGGLAIEAGFVTGGEIVEIGETSLSVVRRSLSSPQSLPSEIRFGRMIGASLEMRRLYPLCQRLADKDLPVIVEGETGTGKEVLAESLHERGARAKGPFVVFDCTAVAPTLVESELFGHERGAYTGATAGRAGVFEQAEGGTLFIDEIGDLAPSLQPKLLRALERSEIRRVGGNRVLRVDVRVIAATRRDLDAEVSAGRFRDDLFHRLSVARIGLPPLRRRRGDVTLLARHFAHELGFVGPLPAGVLQRWEQEPWPGNVRALRNAVARFVAIGDLPDERVVDPPSATDPFGDLLARDLLLAVARQLLLESFERRYVEAMMRRHGTVARAAEASGIARRHLQRLRARHR